MQRIGKNFAGFDSDSNAMIVLEADQPLGAQAHHYYDGLIKKLEADTVHVEHVADFWGDPLTASGAQSNDGKSAYVQVYLRGNQGEALANESVAAVDACHAERHAGSNGCAARQFERDGRRVR
jgi:putative drug exporter of the RND superfamily